MPIPRTRPRTYFGHSCPWMNHESTLEWRNLWQDSFMSVRSPAILTVCLLLTCGFWEGMALAQITTDPPKEATETVFRLPEGVKSLDRGIPVRVALLDGVRFQGKAERWSPDGLEGDFGQIEWKKMSVADHYRLWRTCLVNSGMDAAEGWAGLLVGLELREAEPRFIQRARSRLRTLASEDRMPEIESVINAAVASGRTLQKEQDAARAAQELQVSPPHQRVIGTDKWSLPDAEQQARCAAKAREAHEQKLSPFAMKVAEGASAMVIGNASLKQLALLAARLDALHQDLVRLFEGANPHNIFPGRLVVILVPDRDQLRLLAAENFRQVVPGELDGMLFYDGHDPVIMMIGGDDPSERYEQIAHLFIRAFLHAHRSARALPPWLDSGLVDVLTERMVPDAKESLGRRTRALTAMRAGRHPQWLLEVERDDPRIWPDGPARDLAYVLTTRLWEENPRAMVGLVNDIKDGAAPNDVLRRRFGQRPPEYMNDSATWFRFND